MAGNTTPYRRMPPHIKAAGGGALASLLALAAGRSGISGVGGVDLALSGGGVAAFIVSGLMLARAVLREPPGPVPSVPAAAAPPPARQPGPAAGPGSGALLSVLRLVSAAIEDGAVAVANDSAMRAALRFYVAGACDERVARLDLGADGPVAEALSLLGDSREEAARFAALLDDLLLSPGNRILYRAGRADMAAFLAGGDAPGAAFRAALRRAPGPHDGHAAPAGGPAMAPVMAVAPLPPGGTAAIEAVIGAFGGDAFGRGSGSLVATFAHIGDAVAAARAIRDAGGPGCALSVLPAWAADATVPRAGPLIALARAVPGEVAVTPVLRCAAAAAGDPLPCIRLEGCCGYLLRETPAGQPPVRMRPASLAGPPVPPR